MGMSVFEVLRGAVDIHMHPSPDLGGPRRLDFIEAAKQARDVDMDAIVYKPLTFPTMDRAYAAMKAVPGIKVFGGIMLDWCVGGLNPKAVKVAVEQRGAKYVFFPVFNSAHTMERAAGSEVYEARLKQLGAKRGDKGISILTKTGEILPEVEEIFNIVADNKGTVLDTGHCSPEESLVMIEEARRTGVEQITVSHPTVGIIGATPEQQREMGRKGGYLVQTANQILRPGGLSPQKVYEVIKATGPANNIMATDGGIINSPPPVEQLRLFVYYMERLGVTDRDIDLMIKVNPKKILGLE
jgi:hypothetical protein